MSDVTMDMKTGFEGFFLSEESADVYFICQSDDRQSHIRVPAHKIVLSAKSPAFQTMFYGSLPEKGDVLLPLVTASAFKQFLQLFYYHKPDITMENINEVIDLSKQYQMGGGLKICGDLLKQHLSTDNFIAFYELALLYELTEFKLFCEISAPTWLTAENIEKCTRDELKHILQITQLYADLDMVEVCVKWARNACNERQVDPENMDNIIQEIGDCVEFFAFESMPQQKIQELLNTFDAVLTKDMYKKINGILMTRGTPIDINKILWCAKEGETQKRYIEPIEMLTVIPNKKIALRAVGLSPIYWEDEDRLGEDLYGQLVILKAFNGNDHTVLLRESFNIDPLDDDEEEVKTVHLHRLASAVIFEANQTYKIQVQLMIRSKNEIYSRSKTLEPGKHAYNRSSGNPTEILFEGDSTIASLGIGIEYIDPEIPRIMNPNITSRI